MKQIYLFLWAAIGVVLLSTGCSSTSAIPDGEQLYTGMKPTEYVDADKSEHATSVREELDVVLVTRPNGSLFGSPTLQSPLKIGLWIWNAFSQGTTSFDKWMVKAFGTQPVLMSYANPDLHTTVGRNLLKKRGCKQILSLNLVCAPEGIRKVEEAHPDVDIYTASVDSHLNEHGYIIPGLGDAGDRIFGTR